MCIRDRPPAGQTQASAWRAPPAAGPSAGWVSPPPPRARSPSPPPCDTGDGRPADEGGGRRPGTPWRRRRRVAAGRCRPGRGR
eukprot:206437-Pyramimonas_sp.AAC.1